MTDLNDQPDHLVRLMLPQHRLLGTAAQPDGPAADDLLHAILRAPDPDRAPAGIRRRPWYRFSRRRLFIAVPTATALAAAIFVVSAVLPSTGGEGPLGPAPAQAQALEITEQDGHLVIKILDPVADPPRYQAELRKHGLNIELFVKPVRPELVGRVIFVEESAKTDPELEVIEAPGNCKPDGGCAVGIRVPLGYQAAARVGIGRAPAPGESLEPEPTRPSPSRSR
ncbi:hypothetical protein [Micromonospora sp. HM5-17]|jgi:hypothetical protein|uniref:hypothetical protein n=1 Tax=Micromonospora sp. HM5-17 TaxID=2487710 RepID=UPI000F4AF11F|nr:hypothetical protein [Micromonospora sp. HM5-17]ROT27122.1 hypothetical protein EF879_24300 [Micromonospora sp. HM5-17]